LGLKDDVIRWLKEEEIDSEEVPVPPGAPVEWALNATVKAPLKVMIGVQKPKTKVDRLVLSMIVKVAEQHRSALMSMSEKERAKLMNRLLSNVTSLCPSCIIVFQPQLDIPDTIVVSKVIYDDDIGPMSLGESARTLVNEYVIIVSFFNSEVAKADQGPSTVMHM
jgi:hypothetical protein